MTAQNQDTTFQGKHTLTVFANLGEARLDVQWCLIGHIKQQLVSLQRLVPP